MPGSGCHGGSDSRVSPVVVAETPDAEWLPAWTAVGVAGLAAAGALLEIKATAVIRA
jgi:enamine deaminase RidA (YjgF/YER057c/UK114 family)